MLELSKFSNTKSEALKKKIKIMEELQKGESMSSVSKRFGGNYKSLLRLIKAWESGDEQGFLDSRIGMNEQPLLPRDFTPIQKKQLEEAAETTEDPNYKKRCLAVLKARDFTSYRKLGESVGMDHKLVKKAIQKFLKKGIKGLRKKRSGPKYKNSDEIEEFISYLLDLGDSLWEKKGRKGFVTSAQIAEEADVSEGTVQKALRGQIRPWRRPSKVSRKELSKTATELDQRVEFCDKDDWIGSTDKILLVCNRCGHKRHILANTLRHDKPHCPVCQKKVPKGKRNRTQWIVINLLSTLLGTHLLEDVTPAFLRKATGKNLRVDGYSEKRKIIVEYQGALHNGPVMLPGFKNRDQALEKHEKTVENDSLKRKACKENGYTLIEIPEIKEPSLRYLKPAIISGFRNAIKPKNSDLKVPTEKEIENAYKNSPCLAQNKIPDQKKSNCIKRIQAGESNVNIESKRVGVHKTTIYKWIREFNAGGNEKYNARLTTGLDHT